MKEQKQDDFELKFAEQKREIEQLQEEYTRVSGLKQELIEEYD